VPVRPRAGDARPSRVSRALAHPLMITVAGAILAALVLPLVTRQWQDRQSELDLKRDVVAEMAESTTSAVRQSISYVEQRLGVAPPGAKAEIANTYRTWLVQRSVTRAMIATYFPALEECWYGYSNAITTLLELASVGGGNGRVSTRGISNTLLTSDDQCGWSAQLPGAQQARLARLENRLASKKLLSRQMRQRPPSVTRDALRKNYSDLGELLLIGKDGIIRQIVEADARGYYHGLF
jgi:hypothetical protein